MKEFANILLIKVHINLASKGVYKYHAIIKLMHKL
ncbi:hypothetical protein Fsol_00116 [Candidatus Fokinia solitaria]|uniref:Uncharacterized protein n=1 Tax=Candidatus Fokinia solitaria TaxID=1802984 RepID=A0A2U8BRF8_9RICK|nr:hypothetical protein Fsol_00116 [Candidatus Fokinia solitaria]